MTFEEKLREIVNVEDGYFNSASGSEEIIQAITTLIETDIIGEDEPEAYEFPDMDLHGNVSYMGDTEAEACNALRAEQRTALRGKESK